MCQLKNLKNQILASSKSAMFAFAMFFGSFALSSFQWGNLWMELHQLQKSNEVLTIDDESLVSSDETNGDSASKVEAQAESGPEFPGGVHEMAKFIQKNFKLPEFGNLKPKGTIFVRFVVAANGELSDVKIKKGINDELDKEAVRIIKAMPKWYPGKVNGEFADQSVVIPIKIEYI